jgi:RND family efflux transporter MFP subunit
MPSNTFVYRVGFAAGLFILAAAALSGCGRAESSTPPAAPGAAPPALPVTVTRAVSGQVRNWDEFTGRFQAIQHVELRPHVSGYVERVAFTEGSMVHKGELLFAIDPRPYAATLDQAQAQLALAKAQLSLATTEAVRARRLLAEHAISEEEGDQRISKQSQATATVAAAQAAVETARLNLAFTRVTSPIDGRVSSALVTAGNYVTSGSTVLTTVVSLDPIYVDFDSDEQSYLAYQQGALSGGHKEQRVSVALAGEAGYPHEGRVDFIDNAVDPATGSIHLRAVLDNPQHRFVPGLMARVRLPSSAPYPAVLIPDQAVGTNQDQRYVLVVAANDTVEYRPVQLGSFSEGLRVVRGGIKPGERVIVSGLARARPGAQVAPQEVPVSAQANRAAESAEAASGTAG